ncbi:unnamed protein product, partial [Adineta ricciae]
VAVKMVEAAVRRLVPVLVWANGAERHVLRVAVKMVEAAMRRLEPALVWANGAEQHALRVGVKMVEAAMRRLVPVLVWANGAVGHAQTGFRLIAFTLRPITATVAPLVATIHIVAEVFSYNAPNGKFSLGKHNFSTDDDIYCY